MHFSHRALSLGVIALPLVLLAQSCDPEKVALEVFRKQGLTLLRPARDYVEVGGVVAQPSSGLPRYTEPLDSIPIEENPTVNFGAVILHEVQERKTALGTALSFIARLVMVPVGLQLDHSREVTLSQINTEGVRLKEKALEALIKKPSTVAKLKEHLTAKPKRQAYIVQEVYRSAAMNVSATTAGSLSVGVGPGTVPDCSPKSDDADKTKGKEAETGKPTTPSASEKGKSEGSSTPKADEPKKVAEAAASAEAKEAKQLSSSVGACFANEGKTVLSFQSDKPLPFAVRLAEIELVAGDLRVKLGKFKFPGSLGNSEIERTTAFIRNQPVVRGLIRDTK